MRSAAALAALQQPSSSPATLSMLFEAAERQIAAHAAAVATGAPVDTPTPVATTTVKKGGKAAPVDKPAAPGPPVDTLEAAVRVACSICLRNQAFCDAASRSRMKQFIELLGHPEPLVATRAVQLLETLAAHPRALAALLQVRCVTPQAVLTFWHHVVAVQTSHTHVSCMHATPLCIVEDTKHSHH